MGAAQSTHDGIMHQVLGIDMVAEKSASIAPHPRHLLLEHPIESVHGCISRAVLVAAEASLIHIADPKKKQENT
jgi:hypothetical protein